MYDVPKPYDLSSACYWNSDSQLALYFFIEILTYKKISDLFIISTVWVYEKFTFSLFIL